MLYYDMRNDTVNPASLLVDTCLATSTDGVNWTERHVAGSFDFNFAPIAEGGLFVGDYQGLAAIGPKDLIAFFGVTGSTASSADVESIQLSR